MVFGYTEGFLFFYPFTSKAKPVLMCPIHTDFLTPHHQLDESASLASQDKGSTPKLVNRCLLDLGHRNVILRIIFIPDIVHVWDFSPTAIK